MTALEHIGWIKGLGTLLETVFGRLTFRLRRKPKLYVHFRPGTGVWCLAHSGPGPDAHEYMHVMCDASFANDGDEAMIIIDVFPPGTTAQVQTMRHFVIPPHTMVAERVTAIVAPLASTKGKDWAGKLVFVDQFQRAHKSKKFTFKWVGGPVPPSTR